MKNHDNNTSEISYICVTHNKPFLVKPLNKKPVPVPVPPSSFHRLVKPHRVGYILLLLALCTSFSVFWIGLIPILRCTSATHHPRLQTAQQRFDDDAQVLVTTTTTASSYVDVVNETQQQQQHNISHDDDDENEFWKQPDDMGYRPCLEFSDKYIKRRVSRRRSRMRVLMVVASGGLNQQKNQIADAVVVARILEATLVLPLLHVDPVWGDESEFSDIFDDAHFKETLRDDVHVVSMLPASHLRKRPMPISILEPQIDENWIINHLVAALNKHEILILRAFDSKLSKDLKSDLQKLRCKVAFHALKFRSWIEELGEKLATRMSQGGPYMALHLRLEKDVWVRTGCLPGLGDKADQAIESARELHPELLKSRTNITAKDRYVAGLCPLNAVEITRLLKGLGASRFTKIYWAGGTPFEGDKSLQPLRSEFPFLFNKWTLANEGELDHIKRSSSILAAVDYLVCLRSQVFMANHGGNMAKSMQGHRAFLGHKKYITPNKKQLVPLLFINNKEAANQTKLDQIIKKMHATSLGSPLIRTEKSGRDVIAFPVPECMCTTTTTTTRDLHNSI